MKKGAQIHIDFADGHGFLMLNLNVLHRIVFLHRQIMTVAKYVPPF